MDPQNIERQMRQLHALQDQVSYEDKKAHRSSMETHLEQPLHRLKDWLACHTTRIRASVRQAQRQMRKQVPLTSYFTVPTAAPVRHDVDSPVLPKAQSPRQSASLQTTLSRFFQSVIPRHEAQDHPT